jgi:DNA-binding beta-propeller fold protein YncE
MSCVDSLLSRWQRLRAAGQDVTPEALCAGCPELLDEVRPMVEALKRLEWIGYPSYTASGNGPDKNTIERYSGTTGAFMGIFATGPINGPRGIVFNGGYMYVASAGTNQVMQYNATTGAYLGVFVAAGSGGLSGPSYMTFGPDGNLYVMSSNGVLRYNGSTGAFLGIFIANGSGGLSGARGIAFDPSGSYFYVVSFGSGQVLKYNAQSGAYVGVAASSPSNPWDVKPPPSAIQWRAGVGNEAAGPRRPRRTSCGRPRGGQARARRRR